MHRVILLIILALILPLSAQAGSPKNGGPKRSNTSAATPAAATPAAAGFCGRMIMPPANLKYISRGFSSAHSGIDLMAPLGSPIRAAAAGTVVYAGWYYAYGKIVDIQHDDGLITRYAHMSAFAPGIAAGRPVTAGSIIGAVGMTGRAHGAHVHFEVRINGRAVDPKPYLALAGCMPVPQREPLEVAHAPEERAPEAHTAEARAPEPLTPGAH
jgi:murein DD-endopeptidase MepM/ murein hydrolase activator NlpD